MTIKEDLRKLKKIYNVSEIEILNLLLEIINKKFNTGEIFIRNGKLYERYINLIGEFRERRFRLSKKHIEAIKEELINSLIKINLEKLKKKWLHKVVEGEVIDINDKGYLIKIKGLENFSPLLPFNKSKKKYDIGEKDYFFVNRFIFRKGRIYLLLSYSNKVYEFLVKKILSGFYVEKIKIYKDFIKLKVSPKLPDHKKELLELTLGKKVYLLKDKNE